MSIGAIDFLKDMAMIKITYEGEQADREISNITKLSKSQLTEF